MSRARHKFSVGLAVLAWLCASGAQWDVVQVLAWARMFGENARVLPLREAFARTFSPEARCELCGVVSQARQEQEERSLPAATSETKIVLFAPAAELPVVAAPVREAWPPVAAAAQSHLRLPPPVPPPRG